MDPNELVPLYWPADFLQADAIRQTLEAEGVPCHIDGENLACLEGGGPFGNTARWRMRLMVRGVDLERAREILESGDWPTYT